MKTVICIPAYNPDDKLLIFLEELTKNGFNNIVIVNDGSKAECAYIFDEAINKYHCDVVCHETNKGYGKAIKSAGEYFIDHYMNNKDISGIIHCDCDGQHSLKDIINFSNILDSGKDCLIFGQRDFNKDNIPFKSRFGNNLTAFIFKKMIGIDLKDSQCGLRAISKNYVKFSCEIDGDGFEYPSSIIIEAYKNNLNIIQVPIETIYINNNESTHFDPIKDSYRIYRLLFKSLF